MQSSTVHAGTFAAQGDTTNGSTYARKIFAGGYGDSYLGIYFSRLLGSCCV